MKLLKNIQTSNRGDNMNYMLEKINVLENKEVILKGAEEIVDILLKNEKLDKSEKLMTIELAMAMLNYKLYNISGDNEEMPK